MTKHLRASLKHIEARHRAKEAQIQRLCREQRELIDAGLVVKNEIVLREHLLEGTWVFRCSTGENISFEARASRFKKLDDLLCRRDSNCDYYSVSLLVHGSTVTVTRSDGDLTLVLESKRFASLIGYLGKLKFDLTDIRERIATAVNQRLDLERIEQFIEDAQREKAEKKKPRTRKAGRKS